MKKILFQITTICAASMLSASALAQSMSVSPDSTSQSNKNTGSWQTDATRGSSGSIDASSSSVEASTEVSSDSSSRRLSATGRTANQPLRGSQLIGSEIQSASGSQLGKIEDFIVNPASGRIDFAVISLDSSSASSSSSSSSSPSTSTTRSSDTSSSGKLVPVPWSLLKAASSADTSATSSSQLSTSQQAFTLNVSQSKLNQAPTIDQSWSDIRQANWRQRIYSYYGVQGSSTGGADSPSGATQGSGAQDLQETPPASSGSEKP